jgi:hypothetical protein
VILAAGALLVVAGGSLGAIAARGSSGRPGIDPGASQRTGVGTIAVPAPRESASASPTEPPTISIDALPGEAASSGPQKGGARLRLTASPGWCAIKVDGKERGPTPLLALEVTPGTHQILCTTTRGKQRSTMIVVETGATSSHRFALD